MNNTPPNFNRMPEQYRTQAQNLWGQRQNLAGQFQDYRAANPTGPRPANLVSQAQGIKDQWQALRSNWLPPTPQTPNGNGLGQQFMAQYGQPPGQMRDQWRAFRAQHGGPAPLLGQSGTSNMQRPMWPRPWDE